MWGEVRLKTKQKYERIFHVFQAKPINLILSNGKAVVVMAYNDLRFDSDDAEYLKSLQSEFKNSQVFIFLQSSQDYYQSNMPPPYPKYVPIQPFQLMVLRHRRKIKIEVLRNQSLARKTEEDKMEKNNSKDNILHHLNRENLSQLQNQDDAEMQSFDSDVHDIFNDNRLESKMRMAFSSDGPQISILDVKGIKQSGLIIDFKQSQRSAQQLPVRNTNAEDSYMQMANKKQVEQKGPFLSIVSPNKKEEKKPSFIGYYNSLQKKQPSKILQKYLKQKK